TILVTSLCISLANLKILLLKFILQGPVVIFGRGETTLDSREFLVDSFAGKFVGLSRGVLFADDSGKSGNFRRKTSTFRRLFGKVFLGCKKLLLKTLFLLLRSL